MGKYINWPDGEFDEMSSVYAKAEKDEQDRPILEEMEKQAVAEARANCRAFKKEDGKRVTEEEFDDLTDVDKELMIASLAGFGIGKFSQDFDATTFSAVCTQDAGNLSACVFFTILNRLEKMEGAAQMIAPKWTLELFVPAGCNRSRLGKWEVLAMMLYPWISVRETLAE